MSTEIREFKNYSNSVTMGTTLHELSIGVLNSQDVHEHKLSEHSWKLCEFLVVTTFNGIVWSTVTLPLVKK